MYNVRLKPKAQKSIKKQPRKIQQQLIRQVESLAVNPRPSNCKQLDSQKQIYRLRSGNFRIIYQIQNKKLVVIIAEVGNRKDIERIYRNLGDFLKHF